jgi:hypothetical protein
MDARTIKPVPPTDADIIRHYQSSTLLLELLKPIDTDQQVALHAQLAALHNAGNIDLVAATASTEFQNLEKRHFFTIQQVYSNAMPLMSASPSAMLDMVRRLERQGGGIAASPRNALRKWIGQASERAKEIVRLAQPDPSFDREILMDALVVLGDANSAIPFLAYADPRRQAALAALGAIKPQNLKAGDATFGRLLAVATADANEDMRFTAILAVFDLLRHCKGRASKWIPSLVTAVTAEPSDTTRSALLHGLWRQAALLRARDVEAVLAVASDGDLKSPRLLDTLAGALSHLIGGVHHDTAIDCLSTLVASTGKALPLDDLPMLEHPLTALDRTMLFALAVRWFATGDHMLCQAVSKLIGGVQHRQPFDASLAGFALTGSQMIVVCHKAIGFMPLAPIVAASFVVAALRAGDKAAERDLVQLLFESLLINFRETMAAYLKKIGKDDVAYKPVRVALKLYRSYETSSKIATPLKELQPSSYQRGVVRQNHYLANREIRKDAERQSIFAVLVHKSTLLYGRKAIVYAHGADVPPTSMELKSFSTYIEMPRLQTIDPVGLDWLLNIFRISRPK